MNRALGIGLALGVRSDHRFDYLHESHQQDEEPEYWPPPERTSDSDDGRIRNTHFFRGEELPGPPLAKRSRGLW